MTLVTREKLTTKFSILKLVALLTFRRHRIRKEALSQKVHRDVFCLQICAKYVVLTVVMVHVPFHGGRREMEREVNVMMEST